MKTGLMHILSKWAYKLLRPYIVELIDDKLKPQWTTMILCELDILFGRIIIGGNGLYDNADLNS